MSANLPISLNGNVLGEEGFRDLGIEPGLNPSTPQPLNPLIYVPVLRKNLPHRHLGPFGTHSRRAGSFSAPIVVRSGLRRPIAESGYDRRGTDEPQRRIAQRPASGRSPGRPTRGPRTAPAGLFLP